MARYDVYPNPGGAGYLLDIQSDLLDGLNSRIVLPLLPLDQAPKPAKRLNPTFVVNGIAVTMATQFMAAVPTSALRHPIISLQSHHDEIVAAVDFLFHGF